MLFYKIVFTFDVKKTTCIVMLDKNIKFYLLQDDSAIKHPFWMDVQLGSVKQNLKKVSLDCAIVLQ